jgi:hypothetical protein
MNNTVTKEKKKLHNPKYKDRKRKYNLDNNSTTSPNGIIKGGEGNRECCQRNWL